MKYPKRIQNRLSRIQGQVGGIDRMIKTEQDEGKVMTQLQAVISSLESLKMELLKKQMKESLVEDVMKTLRDSE
jgi:DNA-binding FrmR family transcriptional regulator